ncbi:MAG: shikimate dehydrogenase [Bacillota bacterium]|nr:shikimate dehydrogenase [Bacillota bacterium]
MVDINTGILGLVGYPLGHSLSPLLHNATIEKEKLNYIYLPFPVEEKKFAAAMEGFRAINVRGLNITIPYKEAVIPFLDKVDPLAARIGAVNTIVNEEGVFTGYNTDIMGIVRMIREDGNFSIRGKKVMLLGAGGAARAAGIGVLEEGAASLSVVNRSLTRAEKLAEEWKGYYPAAEIEALPLENRIFRENLKEVELIIDSTSVGMAPHADVAPLIPAEFLHEKMLVVDLVYNPLETCLMQAARAGGAKSLNGLGMLIYQGIEAFRLWTGREIEPVSWWKLTQNMLK